MLQEAKLYQLFLIDERGILTEANYALGAGIAAFSLTSRLLRIAYLDTVSRFIQRMECPPTLFFVACGVPRNVRNKSRTTRDTRNIAGCHLVRQPLDIEL